MAGWVEGSNKSSYCDYGPKGSNYNYSDQWVECEVEAYTSGNYIHWTFWIRCSSGYPHCFIHLNVNGTVIYDKYYEYNEFAYGTSWTKKEGDVWIGDGKDIGIEFGLHTSQSSRTIDKFFGVSRSWWTDGTAPTITITDNGNNTCTISGSLGSDGSYNGITGSTLYYTTNGLQPNGGSSYTTAINVLSPARTYSRTFNIPETCSTIWAVTYCSFSHNSTNTGHISQSVKYYKAPSNPGKPIISYTKSRLTIKEPWTISWDAAQAGNSNSPVAGYRIRLYKNGLPIHIKDSSGTIISTGGTGEQEDKYYDTGSTACSLVINPIDHGLLPGDNIRVFIYAYAIRGDRERMYSGNGENAVISDVYTVQNAGVMRPLVNNKYVEGVVWACIPDSTTDSKIRWVEADIVKTAIKDSSTNSIKWVEGE